MIVAAFSLTLLATVCICSGQQSCDSANATLMADTACYTAYQTFLAGVGIGFSVDQSTFNQVCMEGTCRSQILDFQSSCAGEEEV